MTTPCSRSPTPRPASRSPACPPTTPRASRASAARARAAQPAWAALPLAERIAAIAAFREGVVAERETLARTLTAEVGKPIAPVAQRAERLARPHRFLPRRGRARTAAREKVFADGDDRRAHRRTSRSASIANISAWNYPYFVGGNVFVPALLAGNAVLYKPSEFATLTGLHIARLLHAAGVPDDVFVAVVGGGEVGAALLRAARRRRLLHRLVRHRREDRRRGRAAHGQAAARARRQGPDLRLPTTSTPKAAAESLADGAMYNTGQSCCSVERIYVHERDPRRVRRRLRRRRCRASGSATRSTRGPTSAPITRAPQLDVLEAQVADAHAKGGARCCTGGKRVRRTGNWFEPTVLTDVDHTMALMREESFGPIIGIQKVADDDEAVALMNDTRYGLTAGVYTRGRGARARACSRRSHAGSGLLELLRSRQPAPAVVGLRRFGRRRHAVDLRHPDLHAAEGVAPAHEP